MRRINMKHMKIAHFLGMGVLLVMAVPMAAGYVPKPILYLDAADNPAHPKAWTNLGTAGGQLPSRGGGAKLEQNAGPNGGPAYTADKAGQSYGQAGISLFFEDWTIEIWVKRKGPAVGGGEHQIFGLADRPWPFKQSILLRFDGAETGHIRATLISEEGGGPDGTDHIAPNGLDIGAKRWHHVVLTFDSRSRSLQSYLDGKFLSKDPTNQSFDDKSEVKRITVFRSDVADPDNRVLNGSISLIRMYGRELDENEVRENFMRPRASQAVDPADKLTTTWGRLKKTY